MSPPLLTSPRLKMLRVPATYGAVFPARGSPVAGMSSSSAFTELEVVPEAAVKAVIVRDPVARMFMSPMPNVTRLGRSSGAR
jgi:hypothetical protein